MRFLHPGWVRSFRVLGSLFGVSRSAVLRAMDDLLLAARGITAHDDGERSAVPQTARRGGGCPGSIHGITALAGSAAAGPSPGVKWVRGG
jgi:hypothetical protein